MIAAYVIIFIISFVAIFWFLYRETSMDGTETLLLLFYTAIWPITYFIIVPRIWYNERQDRKEREFSRIKRKWTSN